MSGSQLLVGSPVRGAGSGSCAGASCVLPFPMCTRRSSPTSSVVVTCSRSVAATCSLVTAGFGVATGVSLRTRGPVVSNVNPKTSPIPNAIAGDHRPEVGDDAVDSDVLGPAPHMPAEPGVAWVAGCQHPAAQNQRGQEAQQEDLAGDSRPAPLRPAAEQLGERHRQARRGHETKSGPVLAARRLSAVGQDLRPEPQEKACDHDADQGQCSSC